MGRSELINKIYSDYLDIFLGYEDVPTMHEFIFELKEGSRLSDYMNVTFGERELSMDERWVEFDKMGYVRNLDLIDWVPKTIKTITYKNETIDDF